VPELERNVTGGANRLGGTRGGGKRGGTQAGSSRPSASQARDRIGAALQAQQAFGNGVLG